MCMSIYVDMHYKQHSLTVHMSMTECLSGIQYTKCDVQLSLHSEILSNWYFYQHLIRYSILFVIK